MSWELLQKWIAGRRRRQLAVAKRRAVRRERQRWALWFAGFLGVAALGRFADKVVDFIVELFK